MRIVGGHPERPFVQVGLPEIHRAGIEEAAGDHRVLARTVCREEHRARRRRDARDVEQVLERDRRSGERPAGIGGTGPLARGVGGHGDEGVELGITDGDPAER